MKTTIEEQILIKNLKNEGLQDKYTPEHLIYKICLDSMKDLTSSVPTTSGLTIQDVIGDSGKVGNCNHKDWLFCGYSFYVCSNDRCGSYKSI